MGRARQERGQRQQQWPRALGGWPQKQQQPGPQPGPQEQSEQPIPQVGAGTGAAGGCEGRSPGWSLTALLCPALPSDSYSHLSGRPVRKKTEEEEKLLKLLQGIPRPQDGFTQWCEQMLHTLSTTGSLDGTHKSPGWAGVGAAQAQLGLTPSSLPLSAHGRGDPQGGGIPLRCA